MSFVGKTFGVIGGTIVATILVGAGIEAAHKVLLAPGYDLNQKFKTGDFIVRLVATPYKPMVRLENRILNAVGAPPRKTDVPPQSAHKHQSKRPTIVTYRVGHGISGLKT